MNREILFRGKCVDSGEWVEGAYLPADDGEGFIATSMFYRSPIDETAMCHTYAVDPATVGQYTGLKDKNGQKIFEGDIVLKRTHTGKKQFPVKFDGGMFYAGVGGGSSTPTHRYTLEDTQIEVVGNIYDEKK